MKKPGMTILVIVTLVFVAVFSGYRKNGKLAELRRLELIFAVLLVMGATGLILTLGLNERRRNFAILDTLGAMGRR